MPRRRDILTNNSWLWYENVKKPKQTKTNMNKQYEENVVSWKL